MELVENQKKLYIKTDDNKFFNILTNEWEDEVFLRKSNSYPIKEEIKVWLEKEYNQKKNQWDYKKIPHKRGE